jgi:hypothetical protein
MIGQSREDKGDRPMSTLRGLHTIAFVWQESADGVQLGVLALHSGGYIEKEYPPGEMS